MSIFAFGVKNVLFCLHLFHEISPFYDLLIPIFSILFIVNLVTWTHWVRENVYCPFKRLPLAVISVYFPVFGCWSAVDALPSLHSFHAIVLLHLLHVAMFEYFGAKYSHTFDRLPFGIFSVKRLMASSVCACSVKCCMLFTVIRLLLWKHQWAWATQDKVYIGSWGSFTCAPRNLPSNRFQLAQAPKWSTEICVAFRSG